MTLPRARRIDALVAGLAAARDDDLAARAGRPEAAALLARILESPPGQTPGPARRSPRRRVGLAAAAAVALAVGAALPATGVVREIASFFAGWHGPEAPVPLAADVVVASGRAGVAWQIVAAPSDQGLCLALVHLAGADELIVGGCGYRDIRGDLPRELRGDPASPCAATPTTLAPCGSLPRHWIGPLGAGGGSAGLEARIVFGPLAEDAARVDLLLSDGETVRAQVVRPAGLAPLAVYWATWPCRGACGDDSGPEVALAVVRDAEGRVLERRRPAWNGNPGGDPGGPPPPHSTRG